MSKRPDFRNCDTVHVIANGWRPNRLALWWHLRWSLWCEPIHRAETCPSDPCDGVRIERLRHDSGQVWTVIHVRCDESWLVGGPWHGYYFSCYDNDHGLAECGREDMSWNEAREAMLPFGLSFALASFGREPKDLPCLTAADKKLRNSKEIQRQEEHFRTMARGIRYLHYYGP